MQSLIFTKKLNSQITMDLSVPLFINRAVMDKGTCKYKRKYKRRLEAISHLPSYPGDRVARLPIKTL